MRIAALAAMLAAALTLSAGSSWAQNPPGDDTSAFDDFPLEQPLQHPQWLKESFLFLKDDLQQAVSNGKQGIIVYFGQQRCAYCKKLFDVDFGLADILTYTLRHFDVIPVDIWGVQELTDLKGQVLTERDYALREGTNFTPSLIFYDAQGREALRLRGYYPPYQFRAALEYVADAHYKDETFGDYLERADPTLTCESGELNPEDFFSPPPYNLDRSQIPGERPLVVFFEQSDCHACDVLHSEPLHEPAIHRGFEGFDNVQLDIWSDTPVVTPDGHRTTAKGWARSLGLFYTPSILFFDERGHDIIRVDSVAHFYRLRSVLNYITSRGYLAEPHYQLWRASSGF